LALDRIYFNIETVGNTSAASIPLAIADANEEPGRLQQLSCAARRDI
jgi:3-oxoacyl-[acyl-carrier-protein] synthase III